MACSSAPLPPETFHVNASSFFSMSFGCLLLRCFQRTVDRVATCDRVMLHEYKYRPQYHFFSLLHSTSGCSPFPREYPSRGIRRPVINEGCVLITRRYRCPHRARNPRAEPKTNNIVLGGSFSGHASITSDRLLVRRAGPMLCWT